MAAIWETKWQWNTVYNADSVEWCPVDPFKNVLVCGTYQLTKPEERDTQKNQTRVGKIDLFIINSATEQLDPIQTLDTAGILDQKWCCHKVKGQPYLAAATSDGKIQIYQLSNNENTLRLDLLVEDIVGFDVLALSLDWSTNKDESQTPILIVSDSSGCVSLWVLEDGRLCKVGSWKGHNFEAWTAAFNYWNADIFYSGGDDCLFNSYDRRMPEVATVTNRTHEAGVTAIRSHTLRDHQLLTGSYDEKVRLWDPRNLRKPVTEANVNGGVWRLKWHPSKLDIVLAACMYGGFRILSLENDLNIVSEYIEHESIGYGADWRHGGDSQLVATCSFYDCKMNISEIKFLK